MAAQVAPPAQSTRRDAGRAPVADSPRHQTPSVPTADAGDRCAAPQPRCVVAPEHRQLRAAGRSTAERRPRPRRLRSTERSGLRQAGRHGLARIVEIDTTGGPGFGFEHFKQYDFLRDKEVVLTFDDGPWPENTPAVLKALTDNCVKATFFEIGEHATWHPDITKQVAAAGMTVGSHTWSHKDLAQEPVCQGHRDRPRTRSRWA